MRSIIVLILSLLCTSHLLADERLAYSKISAQLLKNADAVIREKTTEVNIVSPTEMYITERFVVTILKERAKHFATIHESYNKLMSVSSLKGWMYDKDGNEIEKAKKTDIKDIGISAETFFDDTRFKYIEFSNNDYPYTCVFEVERKYNSLFFLPKWDPKPGHSYSVEHATLKVNYPADINLHYRIYNSAIVPNVVTNEGQTTMTFEVNNVPSHDEEDKLLPTKNFVGPAVVLTTDNFALDKVTGSLSSWLTFGKFFYDLNVNRDELPEITKKAVHQLTDTCSSIAGKINLLYSYLQKNTRYVNISLGIGGWQTHEASYVAEKGYGDCKALSNYMKSLLKEAGVTAYQVLVHGGHKSVSKMDLDFPYNVFNHVILCVPNVGDTIWLECTSNKVPAGHLSAFTGDREALLIAPSGGYPVHTPVYSSSINCVVNHADVDINADGAMQVSIKSTYSGNPWDREKYMLDEGKSKVDDYFNSRYKFKTYKVSDYKVSSHCEGKIPFLDEQVSLTGTGNFRRKEKQVIISPMVFPFAVPTANTDEPREDSFEVNESMSVIDTVIFKLPVSVTHTDQQKKIEMHYPFASYRSEIFFESDRIIKQVIYYEQTEGTYSPTLFADYGKLSRTINGKSAYTDLVLTEVH